VPVDRTLQIMAGDLDRAIDARCLEALQAAVHAAKLHPEAD
jgi:hypothetical protein